jgi:nucleoside 2-deoxyribosyltransferase
MKRIFITYSFEIKQNRQNLESFLELIRSAGFQEFCFVRDVENYVNLIQDPKVLMKLTKEEIANSDYLLINCTDKPTGRAAEAGIAYALNIPIIIILKKGIKIKNAMRGIANHIIEYEEMTDIVVPLSSIAKAIL